MRIPVPLLGKPAVLPGEGVTDSTACNVHVRDWAAARWFVGLLFG